MLHNMTKTEKTEKKKTSTDAKICSIHLLHEEEKIVEVKNNEIRCISISFTLTE